MANRVSFEKQLIDSPDREAFEGPEWAVVFRLDECSLVLTQLEAKSALYDLAAAVGCAVSDEPMGRGDRDYGSMNRPKPLSRGDE